MKLSVWFNYKNPAPSDHRKPKENEPKHEGKMRSLIISDFSKISNFADVFRICIFVSIKKETPACFSGITWALANDSLSETNNTYKIQPLLRSTQGLPGTPKPYKALKGLMLYKVLKGLTKGFQQKLKKRFLKAF